jgi:hypothetical protein
MTVRGAISVPPDNATNAPRRRSDLMNIHEELKNVEFCFAAFPVILGTRTAAATLMHSGAGAMGAAAWNFSGERPTHMGTIGVHPTFLGEHHAHTSSCSSSGAGSGEWRRRTAAAAAVAERHRLSEMDAGGRFTSPPAHKEDDR